MTELRRYTRWTRSPGEADDPLRPLTADILSDVEISAHPREGVVEAHVPARAMSPDEARMIGVRLIEAAALADGDRSVKDSGR